MQIIVKYAGMEYKISAEEELSRFFIDNAAEKEYNPAEAVPELLRMGSMYTRTKRAENKNNKLVQAMLEESKEEPEDEE